VNCRHPTTLRWLDQRAIARSRPMVVQVPDGAFLTDARAAPPEVFHPIILRAGSPIARSGQRLTSPTTVRADYGRFQGLDRRAVSARLLELSNHRVQSIPSGKQLRLPERSFDDGTLDQPVGKGDSACCKFRALSRSSLKFHQLGVRSRPGRAPFVCATARVWNLPTHDVAYDCVFEETIGVGHR
jgi:hypothetical protein